MTEKCENCKFRKTNYCQKNKEQITVNDWCGLWKVNVDTKNRHSSVMEFKKGIPPKIEAKQYVLEMSNHPACCGCWNGSENSFVIATVQCTIHEGKLYDSYYEAMFINHKDITGYCELP